MITYDMDRLLAAARTNTGTTGNTDIFNPTQPPVDPGTRQPTDGFTAKDTNTNVFPKPYKDYIPFVPPPTPGGVKPPPTPGNTNTQTFFVLGIAALALYFLAK